MDTQHHRRRTSVVLALCMLLLGCMIVPLEGHTAPLTAAQAQEHVGETATVCGIVTSTTFAAGTPGQPTYLYLGRPYPEHPFMALIWGQDRPKFGQPEITYKDKHLCVTGTIKIVRMIPTIVFTEPGPPHAAPLTLAHDQPPDATLSLSAGSVALGIGFTWGNGVLRYQGKDYPISVERLSVADVGVAHVEATGSVYNLKRLADFNGNYTGVSAGAIVALGAGATTMQNQHGVLITLVGTGQGLKFELSVDGVEMALKQREE